MTFDVFLEHSICARCRYHPGDSAKIMACPECGSVEFMVLLGDEAVLEKARHTARSRGIGFLLNERTRWTLMGLVTVLACIEIVLMYIFG